MIHANEQASLESADEAAIHALLGGLVSSWNAGDGEAYARAFTDDCDYVTFNGDRLTGRAAVANSHQALFSTHLRGSKLLFEHVDMRAAGPAAAIVHGVGNTLLQGQKLPRKSRRSIQTLVAVRKAEGWRLAAFQNTRVFAITPFRALLMAVGI